MKIEKEFLKNRKGMSAILATLLLVVIVVAMGAIVYSWSTGLIGGMMKAPTSTSEALSLDYGAFIDGGANATLAIRNVGDSGVSLQMCYVKGTDGLNGSYTIDPTVNIDPTEVQTVIIQADDITSGASYSSGYSYEFKIVTATGNHFVFTVKY